MTLGTIPAITRHLVPLLQGFAALGYKSRSRGYVDLKAGLLPVPVHVGKHANLPSDELQAVIDARIAGCTEGQIRELVTELHARRAAPK